MASKLLFKSVRGFLFCIPFLFAFAVTACGDDEEEVIENNCSEVCNRWHDCGHPNVDVDTCTNNCTDAVSDADVDTCSNCLFDLTCTTTSAQCDDDCDFID